MYPMKREGINRSLLMRSNWMHLKAMDDARSRVVSTLLKEPKVTSQERLIAGAKHKIVNGENTFATMGKVNESEQIVRKNVEKVSRVMNIQEGRANPFEYFRQHRFDEKVDLAGWFLGPITACEIGSRLFSSSNIVHLFLANNLLGNEGGKAIAEGLEQNSSVKELDLSGNLLGQSATSSIGEMLQKNKTLEKLNLSRNDLTDQDVKFFLSCLDRRTVLKDLDLSHNILADEFAQQMSLILEENIALEKLSINSNHLEGTGLLALLPGLQKTLTLRALNISWNYLHDEGAEILGKIIAENQSLVEISACGNLFTEGAARCLADGVSNNSKLNILRIGQNMISNSGVHEFFSVLSSFNPPITRLEILDIDGIIIDEKCKEVLETELAGKFPLLRVVHFSFMDKMTHLPWKIYGNR